jgi:hypothetical protein
LAGRYSDTTPIGTTGYIGQRYRPETAVYLRDVWFKYSMRDMGWTTSRGSWVHLYLNGLYWGIYNPCERIDAPFAAAHFGGREGDWDVLVGNDNSPNNAVAADGNLVDWQQTMSLVNAGITNDAAYQAVAQRVDLDNLIDYMLLHIFGEAEDWPHHNWYAAHRRATNGLPATKWTFLVWDQEVSLDRLVRRNRVDVGNASNQLIPRPASMRDSASGLSSAASLAIASTSIFSTMARSRRATPSPGCSPLPRKLTAPLWANPRAGAMPASFRSARTSGRVRPSRGTNGGHRNCNG